MRKIRGGSGLGDSIYLRPFVEHYLQRGERVEVCTNYGEVFSGLDVTISPFRRDSVNKVCHYVSGKTRQGTTQWEDLCISAGEEIPFRFDWTIRNTLMTRDLQAMAAGRPIIMVNGGRPPMGRSDGFAREMLPARAAFDTVLAALDGCFTVEVGKGAELYPLIADVDLADRTTPSDLLDIATVAAGLVGQCSFMIPLAEAFDKPLMVVWAAKGLTSATEFIRLCRPQKILSKPTSTFVMDDWSLEQIAAAAREWNPAREPALA